MVPRRKRGFTDAFELEYRAHYGCDLAVHEHEYRLLGALHAFIGEIDSHFDVILRRDARRRDAEVGVGEASVAQSVAEHEQRLIDHNEILAREVVLRIARPAGWMLSI